jgi:hypothetical protein
MSKTQRELKAMREAQRAEATARQRARDRRNLLIIGGILVVVAAGILVVALALNHASQVAQANRLKFQLVTTPLGQVMPDEGAATHIDPSTTRSYKNYPPTSGPHYGQPVGPAQWGTIASMQEGVFLHNLEHGGIVILYNCPSGASCDKLRNDLTNYVTNLAPVEPRFNEVKIVMSPYTRGMQKRVAVLAWHYIEFLDGYDQAEITRFYENHVNQGPEQIA